MGIPEGGRHSGLGNAEERATQLGGGSTTGPGEDTGTVLVWRVPLER